MLNFMENFFKKFFKIVDLLKKYHYNYSNKTNKKGEIKMLEKILLKTYIVYKTKTTGGCSVNEKLENPNMGYMVGVKNFNTLKEMLKVKLEPNEYYGTWKDTKTGITYYDISKNIIDYKKACIVAKNRGELAIYDLKNNSSIYF